MANEACPGESRLRGFLRGECHGAEMQVIAAHLERCPDCERLVESLELEVDTLAKDLLGVPVDRSTVKAPSSLRDEGQALAVPPGDAVAIVSDRGRSSAFEDEQSTEPDVVIAGRYTLVERIGEGGMGDVWVAKQSEPVKRKVALKIIKRGMNSRSVLIRFEQERQALAIMDHPNIAKVLDGGATANGQPFFVMELVNGLPLTKFCDEARLTTRDRLELFVLICRAVQHAHQKGVVHRDLKPSNVLVTLTDGKPTPKVIDFGVAKAIDNKLIDQSLSTQFGAVVGTLEYMAPEQTGFAGTDVDTRADIYSLGVILYELLTGLRPIDSRRLQLAAASEMIRMIQQDEPARPSANLSTDDSLPTLAALRQTEPRRLIAQLRGELDWVVMKCLEKPRDRRYETASGLARDIERYLADEPVEARPASRRRRFGKFLMRNRGPVIGASLIVLAIMIGTAAVIAVQAKSNTELRAANERVRARFELAREAIRSFQNAVNDDEMLKGAPLKALRNKLLRSAAGFYEKLEKLLQDQSDRPSRAILAQTYFELGELTAGIGIQPEALATHQKGLAIRRSLATETDAALPDKLDLAKSLIANGRLLSATGDHASALASQIEARELVQPLATVTNATQAARDVFAKCHHNIGGVLALTGKTTEALESYLHAFTIWEDLANENPQSAEFRGSLALSHHAIGVSRSTTGHIPEALESYRHGLAIEESLVQENPAVTQYKVTLSNFHNAIGILQSRTGRTTEALEAYQKALMIREELVRGNPAVTQFRKGLTTMLNNIGLLHSRTGRTAEALQSLRRAVDLNEELARENPAVTEFRTSLADSYNLLGNVLADTMQTAEALQSYRRALSIREKLFRDNPTVTEFRMRLSGMYYNIGLLLSESGQASEALDSYQNAIAVLEKLARENQSITDIHRRLADAHNRIGGLLDGKMRTAEALASYRKAEQALAEVVRDNPTDAELRSRLAINHASIGMLLSRTGQASEAMKSFRSAIAMQSALVREDPVLTQFRDNLADSYHGIGLLQLHSAQPTAALESHNEALSIWAKLAEDSPTTLSYQSKLAGSRVALGDVFRTMGRIDNARAEYDRAIAIEKRLVRDNPRLLSFTSELASTMRRNGLARSAAEDFAGAVADARRALVLYSELSSPSADELFEVACVHSALVGLAGREGSGISESEREQEGDRAIEFLRRAVAGGYRDAVEIRREPALDPLRVRPEFQLLMMDVDFPSNPLGE